MESRYQNVSPGQGWLAGCNQDFREGAKGLSSHHPVSFTLPSSSLNDGVLDEWMENETLVGYSGLETFNDVLLPLEQDIAELDLLKDLESNYHQEDNNIDLYNASGDFNNLESNPSFTSYESLVYGQYGTEEKEPTSSNLKPLITIKLKKIKLPKKSKQTINEYPVYDYEVLPNTPQIESSPSYEPEFTLQIESSPSYESEFILPEPVEEDGITFDTDVDLGISQDLLHTLNVDELMKEEFDLEQSYEDPFVIDPSSSSVLTLKDALNMDNADSLLENYLSPNRSFQQESPQSSTDHWASSPFASQEGLLSPASVTSTHYSSEGALSPSNSEGYSVDSVLPTVYSLEGVIPPRTKPRKSKKREKMTPESRYLRKKEQNKQAALRYRAKKKQEDDELLKTLKVEEQNNSTLEKDISRLEQEVKFMKKLMRETFIAKKLVPPNAFD